MLELLKHRRNIEDYNLIEYYRARRYPTSYAAASYHEIVMQGALDMQRCLGTAAVAWRKSRHVGTFKYLDPYTYELVTLDVKNKRLLVC